jgi:hypothetical protein
LLEFEEQIPSGPDLLNLGSVKLLGQTGQFAKSVKFNGDDFNPSYTIDPLLFDVILPQVRTGDTMSWVYTLTAQGTTHGFERGYDAFIGDPFGVDVIRDNLAFTVAPANVPEPRPSSLMLFGFVGLLVWRWHKPLAPRFDRSFRWAAIRFVPFRLGFGPDCNSVRSASMS